MAENKKSFILYCDQKGVWEKLDDAQAGRLIKHIISYVNDENPTAADFITELAFEPIKQSLKRDLLQWSETRQSRSIAGKAGAEARWHKIANDGKGILPIAKMAVNANVSVNGSVNATVNDSVIVNESKEFKNDFFVNWINWGDQIVDENDAQWDAMRGRKISRTEMASFLSVATRNGWTMNTQQQFRVSLNGFKSTGTQTSQTDQKERMKNIR